MEVDETAGRGAAHAELCACCREPLDGAAFTWPGCGRPHRLHRACLGEMLCRMPGWPAQRPDPASQESAMAGVQLTCDMGLPRLACPTCRHGWADLPCITAACESAKCIIGKMVDTISGQQTKISATRLGVASTPPGWRVRNSMDPTLT